MNYYFMNSSDNHGDMDLYSLYMYMHHSEVKIYHDMA